MRASFDVYVERSGKKCNAAKKAISILNLSLVHGEMKERKTYLSVTKHYGIWLTHQNIPEGMMAKIKVNL